MRAGVVDTGAFAGCIADSTTALAIRRDIAAGDSLHVAGTPTALINGVRFSGAIPTTMLDSLVRATFTVHRLSATGER
jgi:protein-disulfide isomerase